VIAEVRRLGTNGAVLAERDGNVGDTAEDNEGEMAAEGSCVGVVAGNDIDVVEPDDEEIGGVTSGEVSRAKGEERGLSNNEIVLVCCCS